MEDRLLTFETDTELREETVVIGSGAGGSVSAAFLAEHGRPPLVLEEGPYFAFSPKEAGFSHVMPRVYRGGGYVPIVSDARFVFAEGRCVGGSTMVNAALINKLDDATIEDWRTRFQIQDFSVERMRAYQARAEKELGVSYLPQEQNLADRYFKKGAAAMGWPGVDLPVAASQVNGVWVKNTMQRTFLRRATDKGTRVCAQTRVVRIVEKNNAVTIHALHTDIREKTVALTIRCKQVIVCAGPMQTALLLRRSGWTRHIGNTLKFHPTIRVAAEFPERIEAYRHHMPSFQIKNAVPGATLGSSMSAPSMIASALSFHNVDQKTMAEKIGSMAIYYVAAKGKAACVVRNMPGQAFLARYPLHPHDHLALSRGFLALSKLLFAAGARALYPTLNGIPVATSIDSLEQFETELLPKRSLNLMSIHSFSSCPMGETAWSPVDSYGKLREAKHIFVNDASLIPDSPGVNPQGPLLAIALRNLEKNFS